MKENPQIMILILLAILLVLAGIEIAALLKFL